jgi:hypothetical protein
MKLTAYIFTLIAIIISTQAYAGTYMDLGNGLIHDVETGYTHYCFQTGSLITCN